MSKSKLQRIYVLLGILIFVCAAAIVVSRYEEKKEKIKNSEEIILSLNPEDVTALSWEYEDGSLSFHKEEVWLYDEDENFPVNEEKIEDLLEIFHEFGVSFKIEEVTDESQYGLDNPVCTIHITAENEEEDSDENRVDSREYVIKLGNYSTMDEKRYVSIGDDNVYLVENDPMETYDITINDILQYDDIPDFYEAEAIRFEGMENYEIVYSEEGKNTYLEEDVYFKDGKPLDTSLVNEYLTTIRNLDLSDYVTYNVTEEELQEYGLDEPALMINVDYTYEKENGEESTDTFVLSIGKNKEEIEEARQSEDEEAEYEVPAYARVGDSKIIYQISSLNYKNLSEVTYNDFRHKEVLAASFDDIGSMKITMDGNEYTFTAEGEDEDKIWYYEEEETDLTSIENAMEYITADSFTSEKPSDKEEISFTVTLNLENNPVISVSLYRYDADNCLAVIDGTPTSLVSRSDVIDLMEAVNKIVLK